MDNPIVVLPVLSILVIAVLTRRTLFAMLCGLAIASLILAKGFVKFTGTFFENLYAALSNETFQWLILVIALFGVIITLLERSGAVHEFGAFARRFIKTQKQSLLITILLGMVVFIDDYLSNLVVGSTMKAVTDKLKIPRTQLGYVVNSTAAPICVLIPLSTWAIFFSGLFEADGVTVNGSGLGAYISAIPLIFYGWFALIVMVLQIFGVIPKMGLIKKDYLRVEATGNVFPEGTADSDGSIKEIEDTQEIGSKGGVLNFAVPILVLIAASLLPLVWGGEIDVLTGVGAAVLVAFVLYLAERKLTFKALLTASYDGILSMGFVLVLSVLAFAVQNANIELGLADWVIKTVEPIMNGGFLPVVVFLVCAVYAYATGCFWDMAIIITPIVLPLATAMDVSPILAGAAVFSGAAFGSTTCLYGDGVILSSQAVGIKSLDQMLATIPYALISGGATAVAYLIAGFAM
jgi:Na+/H+ antiporter NhaC